MILFIRLNMRFRAYQFLKEEPIEIQYGISGMVKSRIQSYRETLP